jgi:hypothetical protein
MPNQVNPGFSWIPNGVLIAGQGGQVYAFKMARTAVQSTGSPSPQTVVGPTCVLNVGNYRLVKRWRDQEVTHSGTFGAEAIRRTLMGWSFAAEVFWDAINPPDMMMQRGDGVAMVFGMGDPLSYPTLTQSQPPAEPLAASNSPVSPNPAPAWKAYVSPSALLGECQTIVDSNSGKVIGQNISGRGNAHLMLLPDEKDFYKAYMQYLYQGDANAGGAVAALWNTLHWGAL